MTDTYKMNAMFNAEDVGLAIEAAWNEGLLCGTCMQKIATQDEMSQSDFCPECQAVVISQLMAAVQRRIREELVRRGLPPDSLQIAND